MSVFENLNAINVNGKTEEKNGLTYLSWRWAWAEVKKAYPDAEYSIMKFNGLPYVFDENTGYMVYTTVTIEGKTHEMWLPVMDNANNAMKAQPYTKKTRYKEITVEAATMFDINKTIMRCLVKNLAMFGLGLYIYADEDLPEDEKQAVKEQQTAPQVFYCEECGHVVKGEGKYTAEQVASINSKRYGRIICADCSKKLKQAGS